jgi:hypothetical protein
VGRDGLEIWERKGKLGTVGDLGEAATADRRRRQEMRAVGDLGEAATAANRRRRQTGWEKKARWDLGTTGTRGFFWLSPSRLTPGEFVKTPTVTFLSLTGGPKCSYHRRKRLIRRG